MTPNIIIPSKRSVIEITGLGGKVHRSKSSGRIEHIQAIEISKPGSLDLSLGVSIAYHLVV